MRVAGVDEAGRGCAIGPLVVAGASFYTDDIETLRNLGVRDSKKLTPKRREFLSERIMEITDEVRFFEIQPRSIDAVVNRGVKLRRLNYLEAAAMASVVRELSLTRPTSMPRTPTPRGSESSFPGSSPAGHASYRSTRPTTPIRSSPQPPSSRR